MKTAMLLSLTLFLAIGFGGAFFMDELTGQLLVCSKKQVQGGKINECVGSLTYESCLKKIDPKDDSDKEEIEKLIQSSVKERQQCPGFVGKLTCRTNESKECKQSFADKTLRKDESICNELQDVRDCLWSKLNDSCTIDVLKEELSDVEEVASDCQSGKFKPNCELDSIFACIEPVLFAEVVDNNYACNDTRVAIAKQCLSTFKGDCKDLQREIHDQFVTIDLVCGN